MAKRKKHHSRKRRSHRRGAMGFVKGIDTTNILGIVGGAVVAGYLNKLIPATINDKLVAGGKIAVGVLLPKVVKTNPKLMDGIGAGMIAVGSVDLLKSFGVLSGDFDIPVINGIDEEMGADVLGADLPVINADVLGEDMDMLGMSDED